MRRIISVFLFFSGLAIPVRAIDFYVSPTGSDANPGTQAQPWQTIQHACDSAIAGSTVYILAGTYYESLSMNVSGTAGHYITFTHFANDVVTIDGGSTNTQKVLLTIYDQRYVRIKGLKFANAMGNYSIGIIVQHNSGHIELLNNELYNLHFSTNPNAPVNSNTNVNPLIIYGDHGTIPIDSVLMSGNTIHDCRTGYSEALTVTGNVDGFTITGNSVHDITNIGIDLAGGYQVCADPLLDAARNGLITNNVVYNCVSNVAVAAGIYADGSRNLVIEHNNVHDCGRGYEIGCEIGGQTADNITVRDNLAWHNREAAIGIGGYDYSATGRVINSRVLNNTCYGNAWTNTGGPDDNGELLIEYTENCTIENNLFYATNPTNYLLTAALNSIGLLLDYNLYYHGTSATGAVTIVWNELDPIMGFAAYQAATGKDGHSLFGNPLLVNPATQNFHLAPGSPAYNAGDPGFIPAAGETDLDGEGRLLLGRVDLGADESSVVLPVEYIAPLTGYAVPPQGISLHWSTAVGHGTERFDIQRSTDNLLFQKIGEVAARTEGQQVINYVYGDKNPSAGINYYRLKQIDFDGSTSLSNVTAVAYQPLSIQVLPNLTTDVFRIKSDADWERATLRNIWGAVVRTFSFSDDTKLSGLADGYYWLEIFVDKNGPPVVVPLLKQ